MCRWEDVSVPRRATSPVLIGRTGERASLAGAFRAAADGTPVTVLVAGEAGVGKTRLVTQFVQDVGPDATALFGGCIDEGVPYSPIAAALSSLARSGWDPNDLGERGWSELEALSPDLGRHARDRPPRRDGSAGRLHAAFLQLLEALCADRPVVVIVEDLHWSDASTRNLLMHTMRAARQLPLLAGRHVPHRRAHQAPSATAVPRRGGTAAVHGRRRARPPRRRSSRRAHRRDPRQPAFAGDGVGGVRAVRREPVPRRGADRRRPRQGFRAPAAATAGHPARSHHVADAAGGRGAALRRRRRPADRRRAAATCLVGGAGAARQRCCGSCSTATSSNRMPTTAATSSDMR